MNLTEQPDRKPLEEAANRAATAGAGLMAAGRAVALADHKRMLDLAANRLSDSHRAQMAALEMKPESSEGDDMGGDVTVTGDIHVSQPTQQPKSPSSVLPWVLAAALASGGLGAGAMYAMQSAKTAAPAAAHAAGALYELSISSGDNPTSERSE